MNDFDITLKILLNKKSLTATEAENAMMEIMEGNVSEIKLASWLTALRLKGETPEEISGCATAMNKHSIKVHCEKQPMVDIVGTGGDGADTFNISTAAAFVIAGTGVFVAKHGNRAVSSKSGAADVLTELKVNMEIDASDMERCLNRVGISFLFAQKLHPAMRFAMPVRKELAARTIFNVLGPLSNPANPQKMVIGVYDKKLCRIIAESTKKMNKKHILVVHGNDGMDEISTITTTHICELSNGQILEYEFSPQEYGIKTSCPHAIRGGTPKENAKLIQNVFEGIEQGPPRDIIAINAAAGILVSDKVDSWEKAIELAYDSISSGKAAKKLKDLIKESK